MRCTICNDRYAFHRPCTQAHDGFCHDCAERNWSGTPLDNPAHLPPPEGTRTPRELAAVAHSQQRVLTQATP